MSRVGKNPIIVPENVTVNIDGKTVIVKGKNGELSLKLHPYVSVEKNNNEIKVFVKNPDVKEQSALWGLFRNLINNMVIGVEKKFSKQLDIFGVGFKIAVEGKDLVMNVGHSHPVRFKIPEGIEIKVEKNIITISGFDKQLVGQVAAEVRAIKKVEPYKAKGIKYVDEHVRRKTGKAATKSEQ